MHNQQPKTLASSSPNAAAQQSSMETNENPEEDIALGHLGHRDKLPQPLQATSQVKPRDLEDGNSFIPDGSSGATSNGKKTHHSVVAADRPADKDIVQKQKQSVQNRANLGFMVANKNENVRASGQNRAQTDVAEQTIPANDMKLLNGQSQESDALHKCYGLKSPIINLFENGSQANQKQSNSSAGDCSPFKDMVTPCFIPKYNFTASVDELSLSNSEKRDFSEQCSWFQANSCKYGIQLESSESGTLVGALAKPAGSKKLYVAKRRSSLDLVQNDDKTMGRAYRVSSFSKMTNIKRQITSKQDGIINSLTGERPHNICIMNTERLGVEDDQHSLIPSLDEKCAHSQLLDELTNIKQPQSESPGQKRVQKVALQDNQFLQTDSQPASVFKPTGWEPSCCVDKASNDFACDLLQMMEYTARSQGKMEKNALKDGIQIENLESVPLSHTVRRKQSKIRTDQQNQKFNKMDLLNLEKCSQPSDTFSTSFRSNSAREEGKDLIGDINIDMRREQSHPVKEIIFMGTKTKQFHSSQSLQNFRIGRKTTADPSLLKLQNNSTNSNAKQSTNNKIEDIYSCELEFAESPKLRRSNSYQKRANAMADQGRSPRVPFVQNVRSSLKRNSSQRIANRRNFSPPDHATNYERMQRDSSEILPRRLSIGKSVNDSYRKHYRDQLSSAEKCSASKRSSSNTTPLHPEEVFKKYDNFPDSSLKVSVYKDVSMQIIQAINIIQQIKKFPEIEEQKKEEFKFKKSGFNKLLIFDLDETLIHSKRDEDEMEFLDENGQYMDAEPDFFVKMESPTSTYGEFEQGIFVRPYLQEVLRAVNLDYEVAVFTAGFDWYANPIIDKIDPTGTLIQHRFYRHHCENITYKDQDSVYKNLDFLRGVDLSRTLIVDNQVFSFATHLSNGIPIASFYGDKKDCELIKVMKYVHQLAAEDDLSLANEQQFGLKAMLETPIEKFVNYYQIDEMSESDENDFEEDGLTMHSSLRPNMQIFKNDNEGSVSLEIGSSDEDLQFDESFEEEKKDNTRNHQCERIRFLSACHNDESPKNQTEAQDTVFGSNLLQLRLYAITEAQDGSIISQAHDRGSQILNRQRSAAQDQQENQRLIDIELQQQDSYTRISRNDEGNIGGTLSNQLNSSPIQAANDDNSQDGSAIMQFNSMLLREDDMEQTNTLRIPQTDATENVQQQEQSFSLHLSPYMPQKPSLRHQNTIACAAPSSYYKVSLSTEKAKKRQSSLGQRSSAHTRTQKGQESDAQTLYFTPVSQPKNGPLAHFAQSKLSKPLNRPAQTNNLVKSGEGSVALNLENYQQTEYLSLDKDNSGLGANRASDSYRDIISQQKDTFKPSQVQTFADIVERSQKTLTSVKKTQKIKINQGKDNKNSSSLSPDRRSGSPFQNKRKLLDDKRDGAVSQSFMNKVISNVNNTLKPPNWTVRKQSLMFRLNQQTSPSCVSNIDYHLDQLAQMYRESGQKVRDGTEPSLMEQLVEANPSNASFLTPSSSSQVTKSLLSEQKHLTRFSSSNSVDKYHALKNSINRSNLTVQQKRKALLPQQSANLAVYQMSLGSSDVSSNNGGLCSTIKPIQVPNMCPLPRPAPPSAKMKKKALNKHSLRKDLNTPQMKYQKSDVSPEMKNKQAAILHLSGLMHSQEEDSQQEQQRQPHQPGLFKDDSLMDNSLMDSKKRAKEDSGEAP